MGRDRHGISAGSTKQIRVLSRDGYSLVELLTAVAIIGVVVLGLSSMLTNVAESQARSVILTTFTQTRDLFQQTIKNSESWNRTVLDVTNADMACLRNRTACNANIWYNLKLNYADGSTAFDGTVATQGISPSGALCNNWSVGAPNGACAISYDLQWQATCLNGAATCVSPNVNVRGTAKYSSPIVLSGGTVNLTKYNINVSRGGAAVRQDPVIISYIETDGSGEAGLCENVWITRSLNTIVSDGGSNVVSLAANKFTLLPGTYSCTISSPAYKVGANKTRLVSDLGTAIGARYSSSAMASTRDGSSAAVIQTVIDLDVNTRMYIEHTCEDKPSDGALGSLNDDFSLGRPVANGTAGDFASGVTYTTVNCVRTN